MHAGTLNKVYIRNARYTCMGATYKLPYSAWHKCLELTITNENFIAYKWIAILYAKQNSLEAANLFTSELHWIAANYRLCQANYMLEDVNNVKMATVMCQYNQK